MYTNNKMEVIDLNLNSLGPISMSVGETKTMNFGSGIELLMNDKVKSSSASTNIDLGELDNLENELNELSSMNMPSAPTENKSISGFFGFNRSSRSRYQC